MTTEAGVCNQCGTIGEAASDVEGLCSVCLLELGSSRGEAPADAATPHRLLRPVERGEVGGGWAVPVQILREASRRLRLAAVVVGLAFALSIVLNNALEGAGWHAFSHPGLKNTVAASLLTLSLIVAWLARSRTLSARQLLALSLGYEIAVAFAISLGDHLEPLAADVPLASISWLCVWIVTFPLVVPARPRWAVIAGMASASTWPLAYLVGQALGHQPMAGHALLLNSLENYLAVGLALLATLEIRRLQELGCYELVEKIDHGGMGEIWKARHRMLARPVAVKLIRPRPAGRRASRDETALVRRFYREAEATAALCSAHTVTLHDFGVTPEGDFYYVMDLLEGLDLETLVRRHGPLPPERAVHLLLQACDSLAEAHALGLVHRDIKPANLLVCRWGLAWDFVQVLDFGLVGGDPDGTISGTPSFMAPEIVLGERGFDGRVDLYGLGCVAYWLLTGKRVFEGASMAEVLQHQVHSVPVPPSVRAGIALPESLEAIVLACLAKDPAARPSSAEDLAARLSACALAPRWTQADARAWWEASRAAGLGPDRE
jgi:serine/threonine-protein kinase